MFSFLEYAKNHVDKKQVAEYGKYKVYLVNGKAVRDLSQTAEEFGGWSIHAFQDIIPQDEIWIEDDTKAKEHEALIQSALYVIKQIERGIAPRKAYKASVGREKDYRESKRLSQLHPSRENKPAPDKMYVRKYGHIANENIEVWMVDGNEVRNHFKTDYIEGGHGYVYKWVPNNEIWIEDGICEEEIPFIILHEYVERTLMKYQDMGYEQAHQIAAKVEFSKRPNHFSKKDALGLTTKQAVSLASEYK